MSLIQPIFYCYDPQVMRDAGIHRESLAELIKIHSACLTEKEIDYVKNFEWKTSESYMFPKVHKCKSILEAFEE